MHIWLGHLRALFRLRVSDVPLVFFSERMDERVTRRTRHGTAQHLVSAPATLWKF